MKRLRYCNTTGAKISITFTVNPAESLATNNKFQISAKIYIIIQELSKTNTNISFTLIKCKVLSQYIFDFVKSVMTMPGIALNFDIDAAINMYLCNFDNKVSFTSYAFDV
jgi:hypothetical protein